MDARTLAIVGSVLIVVAGGALVIHAYRRVFEALWVDRRVAELGLSLGGGATGPMQWLASRGDGQAGLVVTSSRTGIGRVSLWLSQRPAAPPRLVLRAFHEYDEPLRKAFFEREVERIVLRRRSWLGRLFGPSALENETLGELATALSMSATADDALVRACLGQPEVRTHALGALDTGFDELVLYPPLGVELVASSPRASLVDPGIVGPALEWLGPLAAAARRVGHR
jgi:hypothetical protein